MTQVKVYRNEQMIGQFDANSDWDESILITEVNLRYDQEAWTNFEVIKT